MAFTKETCFGYALHRHRWFCDEKSLLCERAQAHTRSYVTTARAKQSPFLSPKAESQKKEFSMDFIVFESCNFGVIDITPTSQAGQSISQEQATKLASEYAEHFGYGAITQTHCDKSQEPLLSRLGQILVLDDYLYKCDSSAILYNLGCVFCDLAQCKSWDRERAYRFLQEIYPQKVRANPLGFGIYAQRLVDKTQGSLKYASKYC